LPHDNQIARPYTSDAATRPVQLLSVIIPAFNEIATIAEIIGRVQDIPVPTQIIVVDDGSTDGTTPLLRSLATEGVIELVVLPENQGKGSAVRQGLELVRGDVIIIQDADLEYDPADIPSLLAPIERGLAEVVYGSRFLGPHRAMYFWHAVGNKFLTLTCNVLFNTTLTDMETGYKVFTADVTRSFRVRSNRWGIDPELTAKVLKRGHLIYEVPISYAGRQFHQGKKITWRDGFRVFWALVRFRIAD
jgi:glycosyltransferase involved in cell wall biosynthesis